jgi:hypothetical protein
VADYKPDVFTCHLRPAADGPALALAGYWFHCDYLVEAVVKPLGEGAIGLCLYAQDADNYLLFEWTSGPQGYARVRCIQDGREDYPESWNQLTASPEGGYEPGEWYRLAFQADADCLRAFINGRLVLKVHSVSFGQGRWGLYAAGCEAVFDDVRAESGGEPMGRKSEEQTVRDVWQYGLPAPLRRPGMLEWGWQGQPSHATWYQGALYRDPLLWLSFRSVPPLLRATIGADTEEFGRGYDLEVRPGPRPRLRLRRAAGQTVQTSPASPSQEEEPGAVYQVRWRLLRRGQEVAAGQGTWLAERGYPYLLRFDQVGSQVCASFGRFGRWRVFTWNDPRPLHGRRAGYWSSAEVVDQWGSQAWSPHLLEYRWLQAPVDWRMESGTWVVEAPSGRGFDPCDPVLVFHGSASDEAALWHKLHFADDLVVEVFASGKHDLNVTLCGDGADVRSGYSFIFAGWDRTRSATLKQGKVVADAPFEDPTTAQDPGTMTPWYYLRVEKQGRRLCFAANHQPLCEYTDPQPLAGGKVALWTQQGDLVLYRVRVWYEGVAGKG